MSDFYRRKALEYCPPMRPDEQLAYGLIGLNGEAGEALDIYKKYAYQGHDLDDHHLALELGDVLWCLTCAADALGYSIEELKKMNLEKLHNRYPEGYFSKERSMNRAEGDI